MPALDFNYSPWLILVCGIIAAAISWFMYQGTKEVLPSWARWTLTGLRFLILLLLGIFLLEPLLNSFTKVRYEPIIAVLQDNSESIVIQKDSNFVRTPISGDAGSIYG